MKELIKIQGILNAPKNQTCSHGQSYNYRSCEDILEALKPLLTAEKCLVTLSDEIVRVGEGQSQIFQSNDKYGNVVNNVISHTRFYIKATATITNSEGASVSVSAFAREESEKKGISASQLTGMTSSYARKYALGGLFAIDDCKDADSKIADISDKGVLATNQQKKMLYSMINSDAEKFKEILKPFGITSSKEILASQVNDIKRAIEIHNANG